MHLQPVMTAEVVGAFLDKEFPQVNADGPAYRVVRVGPGEALLRLTPSDRHLRPGGTVSGPSLFTLADLGAYVVILAHIGPVALAVTTHLSINFLRKPEAGAAIDGHCRILKLGRRLAVIETDLKPADGDDLVAHAVSTYSIPPDR